MGNPTDDTSSMITGALTAGQGLAQAFGFSSLAKAFDIEGDVAEGVSSFFDDHPYEAAGAVLLGMALAPLAGEVAAAVGVTDLAAAAITDMAAQAGISLTADQAAGLAAVGIEAYAENGISSGATALYDALTSANSTVPDISGALANMGTATTNLVSDISDMSEDDILSAIAGGTIEDDDYGYSGGDGGDSGDGGDGGDGYYWS